MFWQEQLKYERATMQTGQDAYMKAEKYGEETP
jgi:hypothetical protein